MTKKATITLTDEQIKALPSTSNGLVVVPSPGPDKILAPLMTVLSFDFTGGVYTNVNTAEAGIKLTCGDTDATVNSGHLVLDTYDFKTEVLLPPSYVIHAADYALRVQADNADDGDFTGGNAANRLRVTVIYDVVDAL